MVAVGDLDPAAALDRIAAAFGDWDAQRPRPAGGAAGGRRCRVASASWSRRPMPDKSQADIAYGFVGLARDDPDYYAALVMNNALGQYALGGRLGDSIRERQGMAYYVFSNLEAGRAAGPLMVRAGVSGANVERTIASIDEELGAVLAERLHRGPRSTTRSSTSPARCRGSSRPTPASPASCCRPSCTGWASTTIGGCRD